MYISKNKKISIYKGLYKLMLMIYNNPKYSEMVHTVDMQDELPKFDETLATYKYQYCSTDKFGNKVINIDRYDIKFTKYQIESMAKNAIIRLQNSLICNKIRLYQRYRYGLNFGEMFLISNPKLALFNDTKLMDYLNNSYSAINFSINENDIQNIFEYFRNRNVHKKCDFKLSSKNKYTGKAELESHISYEKVNNFFKYFKNLYNDKKICKPFTFTDKTLTAHNYRYFKDSEILVENIKDTNVKKTAKCSEIYPLHSLTNGEKHYADISVIDSEYDKLINFITLIAPDSPKQVSNSYAIQSEFIRASKVINRFFNYHEYGKYDKEYEPSSYKTGQQLAYDLWQSMYIPEIRWLLRLDPIRDTNHYFDLSTMLTFAEMQYAFSGLNLFDMGIREQIYKKDKEYSDNIETIKKFNDTVKTKYKNIRYELFKDCMRL